nr:hypothetical protein GCM10020092_040260 [Actinoplanes digitatis]
MALWMAVGGVTKDLSDVRGDRLAGRRTLPILLGERRARRVMALVAGAVAGGFVVLAADSPPTVRLASWLVLLGAVVLAWVVCTPARAGTTFSAVDGPTEFSWRPSTSPTYRYFSGLHRLER